MKKKLLSLTLAVALMLGAFSAAYAGTGNDQTAGNTASDSEQVKTAEKAVGQEANFPT